MFNVNPKLLMKQDEDKPEMNNQSEVTKLKQLQKELEDSFTAKSKEITESIQRLEKVGKEKWEPQRGEFGFNSRYVMDDINYCGAVTNTRQTEASAQKALEAQTLYNKIGAFIEEKVPGYEPNWSDWSERKYYIYRDMSSDDYEIDSHTYLQNLTDQYMPRHVALELVVLLNEGRF